MQVKSICNYNHPAFKSKLESTNTLKSAFDNAIETGNKRFLFAIKNIINDGKNDIITLHSFGEEGIPLSEYYLQTILYKNNSEIDHIDNTFVPRWEGHKHKSKGDFVDDAMRLIIRNFGGSKEESKQIPKKKIIAKLQEIYPKCTIKI